MDEIAWWVDLITASATIRFCLAIAGIARVVLLVSQLQSFPLDLSLVNAGVAGVAGVAAAHSGSLLLELEHRILRLNQC